MSDIGPLYVGRSLLRREDRRLLRGQGQFIADLVLPRMLHAVLVRSPVAHARIRSVDLSRAAAFIPTATPLYRWSAAVSSAPMIRAPARRRSGPRPRWFIGCGAKPPR